jgi:predicted GIY-YIG superfamily endonuclease
MTGVYKLVWAKTGYFYIGSSKDIQYRYRQHILLIQRIQHTKLIQKIANQHGLPSLELLEECDTSIIEEREIYYFKKYFDNYLCLNKNCPGKKGLKAHSEHEFQKLLKSYTNVT